MTREELYLEQQVSFSRVNGLSGAGKIVRIGRLSVVVCLIPTIDTAWELSEEDVDESLWDKYLNKGLRGWNVFISRLSYIPTKTKLGNII